MQDLRANSTVGQKEQKNWSFGDSALENELSLQFLIKYLEKTGKKKRQELIALTDFSKLNATEQDILI